MSTKIFDFDFSELTQFRKDLMEMATDYDWKEDLIRAQGNQMIDEARKRTPVKTGALKRAWLTDNRNTPIKRNANNEFELEIQNTTYYAKIINDGERSGVSFYTKGYHMLEESENQLRTNGRPVEKVFQKRAKEMKAFDDN